MNPLILGLVYFGVFTPFGVVMRLFGWDSMRREWQPEADSYWLERDPKGPAPDSMKFQF
ncbi:MAG: hypothetical protein HOI95_00790 [Chromatiales bacterium]|jgi:hypothetical protein|nr:hypothetical protein [Chromatiales bacterium]